MSVGGGDRSGDLKREENRERREGLGRAVARHFCSCQPPPTPPGEGEKLPVCEVMAPPNFLAGARGRPAPLRRVHLSRSTGLG